MKRLTFFVLVAVGLTVVWAGCDAAGVGEEELGAVLLEGRVTDASGNGIEGARVIVPPTEADLEEVGEGDPPPESTSARTDSLGNYSLVINIHSGTELDVRVVKGELEASEVITVFPGQTRSDVDFILGGEGEETPSNTETTVVTGDVLSVSGGAPPANARVVVTNGAAGGPFSARVDSITGAYSLDVQITGGTELTIEAISDLFTAQRVVTVFPNETRSNVDFVLGSGPFTVSGQVLNADGEPIYGARVEVEANEQTAGDESPYTTTDANGAYSLTIELTGSTELTIRTVLGELQSEREVTAFPNENQSGFDFILGQSTGGGTATITGRVSDNQDNPIVDVRIEVPATAQTIGGQPFTTLTDANGEFSLDVALSTSAEVTVRAVRDDLSAERTITLVPGQTRAGIDFVLGGAADEMGVAVIEGRVTNGNGDPLSDARIEALANEQTVSEQAISTRANPDGSYRLEVEITASTELTIHAVSDGLEAEQIVTVFPNETHGNVDFVLSTPDEGGEGGGNEGAEEESGTPAVIQLLDVSRTVIGIQGSGSPETSRITYQVVDSAGRPVTLDHATPLRFSLSNGSALLGATIAPAEVTTNNEGKATVSLSSGTKAGTVQIIAEGTAADGSTIRSVPVSVTIHGGLPDQAHFSISTDPNNVPGLIMNGLEIEVSVIVGDRYSNPVKPNTAVYFETTGGVIEGSILTDELGQGTVTLLSGNPRPFDDGVVVITASTQNRDGETIEVQTAVLFTSSSRVVMTHLPTGELPQPLDLSDEDDVEALYQQLGPEFPLGGYRFTVTDINNNPLAEGSSVTFEAEGTEITADGNYPIRRTIFRDQNGDGDALHYADVVRGLGITRFSGSAIAEDDPTDTPDLESFTITVVTPHTERSYKFVEPNASASSQVIFYKNGEPAAKLQNGQIVWER